MFMQTGDNTRCDFSTILSVLKRNSPMLLSVYKPLLDTRMMKMVPNKLLWKSINLVIYASRLVKGMPYLMSFRSFWSNRNADLLAKELDFLQDDVVMI